MSFVWSRWQAVVVLFALTFAATYEASLGMFTLWLTTDTYMHGLFVLPLAFILAKSRPWPERDSSPLSPFIYQPYFAFLGRSDSVWQVGDD